jgi:two-component system response regulator MprA
MRKRILIIEDEERILDFLKRGLTYEGYQIDTALDGSQSLSFTFDTSPDRVILDWMLPEVEPGLDGLEVCRRLRDTGDMPILMLT